MSQRRLVNAFARACAGPIFVVIALVACGGTQHPAPEPDRDPTVRAAIADSCGPEGSEVSTAQPTAHVDGGPADTGLTLEQKVARGERIVGRVCQASQVVGRRVEAARVAKDAVRLLCIRDKLASIGAAGRLARERKSALQSAASRHDAELSDHEFVILTVLDQRVEQLTAESNQCIGDEPPAYVGSGAGHPYVTTTIFYATDRKPTHAAGPYDEFGPERSTTGLTFGSCDVAIPADHKLGELETHIWWKLQLRDDPNRDVTLLSVVTTSKDQFLREIEDRRKADGKRTLVFVHGYNVSFDEAARRTAQLAYDLNFPGAPVMFSWPSKGKLLDYTWDKDASRWSGDDLAEVLRAIAKDSDQEITLLVHSMGNEAMAAAVTQIAADTPSVREVILAAPDIDADYFIRDVAPRLKGFSGRTTLYAASNDEALAVSMRVNGDRRAGESGSHIVIAAGIETVDVSGVKSGLLGHSYYGDNRSVLSDLFAIIMKHTPPSDRFGLRPASRNPGTYWVFAPSTR